MWIIFSILCMVTMVTAEIIGKLAVDSDELAPIKLRMTGMIISFVVGMLLYFFHVGETGRAPWMLIADHPMMLVIMLCLVFSEFLYLFSLKYVGMTIMEAISSLEGVAIFIGLIVINLISGKLRAVNDMLKPERLVLILLILVGTVLLPNIELLAARKDAVRDEHKKEKSKIVFGIVIALLAVLFSCGDSLITDTLLDSGAIGTVDIVMTVYFSQILMLPIFCYFLVRQSGFKKISWKVVNRYSISYAVLYVLYVFLGVMAVSSDAVRSEVMYLIYPVISILGARIVLKEKYTWRQNICIWLITLAAIVFCLVDYFV